MSIYNIKWQMKIKSLCIINAWSSKWIVNRRDTPFAFKLDWKTTNDRNGAAISIKLQCDDIKSTKSLRIIGHAQRLIVSSQGHDVASTGLVPLKTQIMQKGCRRNKSVRKRSVFDSSDGGWCDDWAHLQSALCRHDNRPHINTHWTI